MTTYIVARVFLDPNVIAYQFDAGEPAKQRRVREVFAESTHDFVLSTPFFSRSSWS
ncbi:hypothetical protein [Georgenia yuyongxinii]